MKRHPALTLTLSIFYAIITLTLLLYLLNKENETNALLLGFVLLALLFVISYLGKNIQLSQTQLQVNYRDDEIKKLKEELSDMTIDRDKYRLSYSKTQTQSGKYQNENILLKSENKKLLFNIKDLEMDLEDRTRQLFGAIDEIKQLKEMPSSKGIEFIAEPAEYNIGQEMECVEGIEGALTVGKKYPIKDEYAAFIVVVDDEGFDRSFNKCRFRPVTKEKEAEK